MENQDIFIADHSLIVFVWEDDELYPNGTKVAFEVNELTNLITKEAYASYHDTHLGYDVGFGYSSYEVIPNMTKEEYYQTYTKVEPSYS